ncbi:MAG: O-antigen ligase family protein [Bacteroidota bacterium]
MMKGCIEETRASFRGRSLDVAVWAASITAIAALIFSIALAQAAVLIAVLIWAYGMVREPALRPRSSPIFWAYAAFIAARTLAIATSIDPGASLDAFRTEIPFHLFFFVVYSTFHPARQDRMLLFIRLLILAAVVATIIGFIRYAVGMDERLTSTTSGYYTLGMFLASVFTVAFALGRRKDIFPNRSLWIAVCVLLLLGLLFTFNRMHWMIAGLAALIIGISRERRILSVLVALAAAALIFVAPLQERFLQLLNAGGNMSGRDIIWRGAWMIGGEHPFTGFGLRTFPDVFPLFDQMPDKGVGSWHNDYLQVYMDSGLIALIPILIVLILTFTLAYRAMHRWPAKTLQYDLTYALTIMLIGFVIAGGMLDSLLSILFRAGIAIVAVLGLTGPLDRDTQIDSDAILEVTMVPDTEDWPAGK